MEVHHLSQPGLGAVDLQLVLFYIHLTIRHSRSIHLFVFVLCSDKWPDYRVNFLMTYLNFAGVATKPDGF